MTMFEAGRRDAAKGIVRPDLYTLAPGYRNGFKASCASRGIVIVD
jgi:hypothetical protein